MHECQHCHYRFEDAESLRRHLEEGSGCPEQDEPTYLEFIEQQSNGWCVVYLGRERAPKATLFANVVGPFASQKEARTHAATVRAKYRRQDARGDATGSEMIKVSVRPLWKKE